MTDPFAHHPELRDRIVDPETSAFRDFSIAKLETIARENGLPLNWWWSDAEREARRAGALAGRADGDLWVFAYGSLMWDPAFHFAEVRRAHAPEHARRFIIRDIYGGRGTEDRPGLMAALDDGAGCDGLAFRIEAAHVEHETARIWTREQIGPAYLSRFVEVTLSDGPRTALTFVADHAATLIDAGMSRSDQIRFAATGEGFLGASLDYLPNLAGHFEALGIEDADVTDLLAAAEDFALERIDG